MGFGIRRVATRRKAGTALMQLDFPQSSEWSSNDMFLILRTAKAWGLTPSQFRQCNYTDQMEMIAETVASAKMQAYEVYLAEKKAEKARNK